MSIDMLCAFEYFFNERLELAKNVIGNQSQNHAYYAEERQWGGKAQPTHFNFEMCCWRKAIQICLPEMQTSECSIKLSLNSH